jgi:hypothetical protein
MKHLKTFEEKDLTEIKWVNIANIVKPDKLPLNPSSLDLALALKEGEVTPKDLPPITVQQNPNGSLIISDGRHRYVAFKLNGLTEIKAQVFKDKRNLKQSI